MDGQKVVKIFNHEEESKEQFDLLNDDLKEQSTRANTFANILMPLMAQTGNLTYLLVATLGATLSSQAYFRLRLVCWHRSLLLRGTLRCRWRRFPNR